MNYCPSCKAEIDAGNGTTCPNCGQSTTVAIAEQTVSVIPERTSRPGTFKVVISLDRTGSLSTFQQGVMSTVEKVLNCSIGIGGNLDIDAWSFGDVSHGEQPNQLVQSGTSDQVMAAIKAVKFHGGFDLAESHADEIERLLRVSAWGAPQSRCRNVLWLLLNDETKPLMSGRTFADLGSEIKAKHVKLILVCQPTPNLQEIVNAANGFLIEISNNPDEQELHQVVNSLNATLTATLGGSGTIPMCAKTQQTNN